MNPKLTLLLLLALPLQLSMAQETEEDFYWPREIDHEKGVVTLYQPEWESFEGNSLTGRMALSMKPEDGEIVFGAFMFDARVETDTEQRIVIVKSIDITETRFPDADAEKIAAFKGWLEGLVEGKDLKMSLDRLLASLDHLADQRALSADLNNAPPNIFFRTEPAILVYIDGDPILQDAETSGVKYVVNSPFFIAQDTRRGDYFIKGAKWWYTSQQITSGWVETQKVPSKVRKLGDKSIDPEAAQDSAIQDLKEAPELIVVTAPGELVQTDGEPEYAPIEGTSLLYVKNTESDIISDINSQQHYLLLAGRWYSSRSLADGDWKFIEPDDLPEEFQEIPAESDKGNVRTSVPGTDEAKTALLEQSIPQTATVDRKTATVDVQYDGNPEFQRIEGTGVSYAVNADKDVLLIKNVYYCVDNGIWFQAQQPAGPWEVSVVRPDEVDQIPPDEPVYNTKYVYIYDSTPDVVYVGYLPGYTCSYVYGSVVVYGTGWYYHPWYRSYYYPRPCTWGFGVHYNPWTGWGFSVGVSYGWFSVSYGSYGMWGPAGYRYGYRYGYHRGYYHGYNRGYAQGYARGYARGHYQGSRNNVYHNRANGVRNTGVARPQTSPGSAARPQTRPGPGTRPQTRPTESRPATREARPAADPSTRDLSPRTRPSQQPNNVYSDRSGNVYKRDNNGGVQQRNKGQWNQPSTQQRNRDVNRSYQQRQRGTQNYNNYNRSRGGGARAAPRRRG